MKTVLRSLTFISAMLLIFGCATKPVKTIENLKAAYNGESTASAKYAAFAEKAKAEGLDTVAVMFLATSKAEAIHAANHLKVLEKLGETCFVFNDRDLEFERSIKHAFDPEDILNPGKLIPDQPCGR